MTRPPSLSLEEPEDEAASKFEGLGIRSAQEIFAGNSLASSKGQHRRSLGGSPVSKSPQRESLNDVLLPNIPISQNDEDISPTAIQHLRPVSRYSSSSRSLLSPPTPTEPHGFRHIKGPAPVQLDLPTFMDMQAVEAASEMHTRNGSWVLPTHRSPSPSPNFTQSPRASHDHTPPVHVPRTSQDLPSDDTQEALHAPIPTRDSDFLSSQESFNDVELNPHDGAENIWARTSNV